MTGLIGLIFHPQGRVYLLGILWFLTCIIFGPPMGGFTFFNLFSYLFLSAIILTSGIGALPKWGKYGIIFIILGPIMISIGSYFALLHGWGVMNTPGYIWYTLLLSPLIIFGYVFSIFGALCIGYNIRLNLESRLNSKSFGLVLMVIGAVLLFFPVIFTFLRDSFISIDFIDPNTAYRYSDFPMPLFYTINATIQLVLLMMTLIGASLLYGVVRTSIGIVIFLIGFLSSISAFFFPSLVSLLLYFNVVSIIAIGGVWFGASYSVVKEKLSSGIQPD